MSYILSKKSWSVVSVLIISAFFLFITTTVQAQNAWTPPPGVFTDPTSNTRPPIHVGSNNQAKGPAEWLSSGSGGVLEGGHLLSRFGIAAKRVGSDEFCLRTNTNTQPLTTVLSLTSIFNQTSPSAYDCISTATGGWPTAGDSLWSDLGTTLRTTDDRDILVPGYDFVSTDASIFLGDNEHSIRSVFGQGLVFDTYGVIDPMVIKQGTGNVGIGTTDPTAKLDVDGTFRLRGTPTAGQALVATAAEDGTVEWGNGSDLPTPANDNQTLRYEEDDQKWVVSNLLTNGDVPPTPANYANSDNEKTIFIRRAGIELPPIIGTPSNNLLLFNKDSEQGFVGKVLESMQAKTVFAQLFSAYQSAPALLDARIDVPTPKGLVVNGAGTTEIDKLVVWENTIFNPGPDQIRIRDGNVYGDVNFDDNVTVEGETHLNRTVISGGALLSSWGGNFDWGGSGNFNVSTEATFENKVTTRSDTVVEQLSHAATQSQHVCADNDGKLVLCDAEHGSQTFTAAMHFENGIFAGIKYVSDGSLGISESNNPINFIPPAGLANLFTVEVWGAGGGGAGGDSKVATNEEGSGGGGGASGAYTIATNVDLSPGAPYRATPGVGGNPGERGQCNSWGSCVSEDEATDGGNGGYSKLDRVNSNNGNYIWIEAPGGGGGNVNQNGTGSGGTPNANGGNHGGTYTQGIAGGNPGGSIDPSCRTDQYGHTETDRAGGKGASSIDGGNGGYKGSCNGLDGGNGGGGSYATGGGGGGGGSAVTTARKLHGGAGARGGFGKIKITW